MRLVGIANLSIDENGVIGGFKSADPAVYATFSDDSVPLDHDHIADCASVLRLSAGNITENGASVADEHHVVKGITRC